MDKKTKKKSNIDSLEKEILVDFEKGKFISVKNSKEKIKQTEKAADSFMRRDSRINIRVSGSDLNMIRRIAVQEGLPYQTLLASVIHKYAAGGLVDKGHLSKITHK